MLNQKFSTSLFYGSLGLLLSAAYFPTTAGAATITNIEFRGGGCVMSDDPGNCSNATWNVAASSPYLVDIYKDFSKVESDEEEDDGGGSRGAANGSNGKPDADVHESEDTHDHVEEFERLAPLHMFITLENSGNSAGYDDYTFNEEILNNTGIDWNGFLFALKRNEEGNASFLTDDSYPLSADSFDDLTARNKKLEWSNGSLGEDGGLFGFTVRFMDIDPYLKDDGVTWVDSYTIMLQEFPLTPLTASEPVPEPATMLLFGVGLSSLIGARRRKKK